MTLEELNKLDDGEIVRGYLKSREGMSYLGKNLRVSSTAGRMVRWTSMGFPSVMSKPNWLASL